MALCVCVCVKILAQGIWELSNLQAHTDTMGLVQDSNPRPSWLQAPTVCFLISSSNPFQVDPSLAADSVF